MFDLEFKPTILIVDDTPQNLQLLGSLLHAENYKVAAANNASSALKYLKDKTPDLILLDIMMPETDGFTLCTQIKQNLQLADIPVIFISAKNDTEDHIEGFSRGGVDYITKPFVREILLARIQVHLKLKQTLQTLQSMSITDSLTGAYNRRYALETLKKTISLSQRRNSPFVLCYIDINYLKDVNDNSGHNKGDEMISTLAQITMDRVRTSDSVFRMGGDEFMILFPDSQILNIEVLIQDLITIAKKHSFAGNPLSFAHGLAQFDPQNPQKSDELIRLADEQMYLKKQNDHEQTNGK